MAKKGRPRLYKNKKTAELAANRRSNIYNKEHRTPFLFRFSNDIEPDKSIIAKLQSVPNRSDYLRKLILEDIEREKGKK